MSLLDTVIVVDDDDDDDDADADDDDENDNDVGIKGNKDLDDVARLVKRRSLWEIMLNKKSSPRTQLPNELL